MTTLTVQSILPNEEYAAQRDRIRARVMALKEPRRVHLGEHLTLLFENAETLRYQVQEMLRIERRSAPEDVEHEVRTYAELLGGPGELACTLLIEIEDPGERDRKLRQWLDLPRQLFAVLEDGTRVPATFDERQVGEDRLSAVQYLKFDTGGRAPRSFVWERPGATASVDLTDEQRAALAADLEEPG